MREHTHTKGNHISDEDLYHHLRTDHGRLSRITEEENLNKVHALEHARAKKKPKEKKA